MSHSLTPWTVVLCPWDSPGKNTGASCHFLLQRKPQLSRIAGRVFNIWATREAPLVLVGQPFTPENLMSYIQSSLSSLFSFAGLFEFLLKNNTLSTIFISTLFFFLTGDSTCHHLTWYIIFTCLYFHHHYILGNFSLSAYTFCLEDSWYAAFIPQIHESISH